MLEKRIKEIDELAGSSDWNTDLREERSKVKSEWHELIFKEERVLRLKSKFKWAKEWDANNKLFHNRIHFPN